MCYHQIHWGGGIGIPIEYSVLWAPRVSKHDFNLFSCAMYTTVQSSKCVQVYRLEYPGKILALFDLQLEDGASAKLPDFYLFDVTDVNGRTTFVVQGTSVKCAQYLIIYAAMLSPWGPGGPVSPPLFRCEGAQAGTVGNHLQASQTADVHQTS